MVADFSFDILPALQDVGAFHFKFFPTSATSTHTPKNEHPFFLCFVGCCELSPSCIHYWDQIGSAHVESEVEFLSLSLQIEESKESAIWSVFPRLHRKYCYVDFSVLIL